jgi:hypothetical protein
MAGTPKNTLNTFGGPIFKGFIKFCVEQATKESALLVATMLQRRNAKSESYSQHGLSFILIEVPTIACRVG